jgi:hypothetical protein
MEDENEKNQRQKKPKYLKKGPRHGMLGTLKKYMRAGLPTQSPCAWLLLLFFVIIFFNIICSCFFKRKQVVAYCA